MKSTLILLLVLLSLPLTPKPSLAESDKPLTSAAEAFYGENYLEARELVIQDESLSPPEKLYNLGLIDAKQGNGALALAQLRHAIYLRPTFSQARHALKTIRDELRLPEPSPSPYERARAALWWTTPLALYPVLLLATLLAGGWRVLEWLEVSRQNQAQDLEVPAPPWTGVSLLTLGLLFASLLGLQLSDRHFSERGTYVGASGLHAGPNASAPEISPLRPGEEMILLRNHDDWIMVERLGGTSGWIPSKDLYVTSRPFR